MIFPARSSSVSQFINKFWDWKSYKICHRPSSGTHCRFEGLCRQLRLSYSTNRRSAHAFRVCFAGAGLAPPPGKSYEAAAAEAAAVGVHHWRGADGDAAGCGAAAAVEGCGDDGGAMAGSSSSSSSSGAHVAGGGELWQAAAIEGWHRWGVQLLDDSTPWAQPQFAPPPSCSAPTGAEPTEGQPEASRRHGCVVYLTAESPHELQTIEPGE